MQENDIVIAIQEILTDILGQADIELTRDSSAKEIGRASCRERV